MRGARGGVVVVGVLALLASCGDSGPVKAGQSAVTSTVSAAAAPMVDYVRSLADISHIDQGRAVDTLCAAWQTNRGDNQSINDYVHDLLDSGRTSTEPAEPSHQQVSLAVTTACASSKADPARFVSAIADELHMSDQDLKQKVVAACLRYRTRLARDKASGNTGNADIDPFVRSVAADGGVDQPALRAAVDAICPS